VLNGPVVIRTRCLQVAWMEEILGKVAFLLIVICVWGRRGSQSTIPAVINWPTLLDDCDDCGAVSGMNEWQGTMKFVFLRSIRRVASYGYFPSSPILVTLMMEVLISSETSVLTRATGHESPRKRHSS
jgi:hypothetical protein